MKMTTPKYLEDCAGYFDDFYNEEKTGRLDIAEGDGDCQRLHLDITNLADALSDACKAFWDRVKELEARPRVADPNAEHRLSMQQLGVTPGRRASI